MQAELGRSTVYLLLVERLSGRSTVFCLGRSNVCLGRSNVWHHPRLSDLDLDFKTPSTGGLHPWGVRPCGVTRVMLSFLDVDVVLFTGELSSGRSTVGSPAHFWPLGKLNTWVYGGGSIPLGGRTCTPPVSFCSWVLYWLDQTWM